MFAMSESVTKSFSGGNGPALFPTASPEKMTKAIQLMEEEAASFNWPSLWYANVRLPMLRSKSLALSKKERSSSWLNHELDRVAQNAAIPVVT